MSNTDNAPSMAVLAQLRVNAASWGPEVRISGNIRAGDIVRALDDVFGMWMDTVTPEAIRKAAEAVISNNDPA